MKKIDFHIHYLPEYATEKEILISMDKNNIESFVSILDTRIAGLLEQIKK